jgi:hypothetical protein
VAGVSLVCILALALYLLKRRRRSAEISMAEDRFDNFKDPGPLSSHSSYIDPGNMSCNQMESKNTQKLNIPAPKDFMDKKVGRIERQKLTKAEGYRNGSHAK